MFICLYVDVQQGSTVTMYRVLWLSRASCYKNLMSASTFVSPLALTKCVKCVISGGRGGNLWLSHWRNESFIFQKSKGIWNLFYKYLVVTDLAELLPLLQHKSMPHVDKPPQNSKQTFVYIYPVSRLRQICPGFTWEEWVRTLSKDLISAVQSEPVLSLKEVDSVCSPCLQTFEVRLRWNGQDKRL